MEARRRLDSWKEIAAHFERRVRTVQRWEKDEGLPVHRHGHVKRGTVHAYADELDAWRASRTIPPEEPAPAGEEGSLEEAPPIAALAAPRGDAVPPPGSGPWPELAARPAASLDGTPARAARRRDLRMPTVLGLLGVLLLFAATLGRVSGSPQSAAPSTDPDGVLDARYLLHRGGPEQVRRAVAICEEGAAAAPRSAALRECLAHGLLLLARSGHLAPRDGFERAKAEADRALAIDPSRAVARTVRAWATYSFDWRLADAEKEFRAAIAAGSPDASAAAFPHHGLASLLSVLARHDESIAELRKAQRLQPLSAALNDDGCWFFYRARRFPEALAEAERALELEPGRRGAVECVIDAKEALGDVEGARRAAVSVLRSVGDPGAAAVETMEARAALDAYRRRLLARAEERARTQPAYLASMPLAMLHGRLGDRDDAVRWLAKGVDARSAVVLLVRVHPYFDPVRDDPRVEALLRRAGV